MDTERQFSEFAWVNWLIKYHHFLAIFMIILLLFTNTVLVLPKLWTAIELKYIVYLIALFITLVFNLIFLTKSSEPQEKYYKFKYVMLSVFCIFILVVMTLWI